jgi:hypothetical protein
MAIWKEPIFDRTLADVTFAIAQIEAWKNSHSHVGDVEVLTDTVKVAVNGDVKLEGDFVKLQAGNAYIENETLVLKLGTIYDLKGCFNVSDIIRIEGNISYLAEHFTRYLYPVGVNTRVWTNTSLPNLDDMKRIASNIHSIFNGFYTPDGAETVPEVMLSYQDINAIEHNLYLLKQMLDSMILSFIPSGTTKCGVRRLPLRR